MKKFDVRSWMIMAQMIALSIVFSRFLSLQTDILRLSLGYIPIILAGALFGPVAGGIVGVAADFLGTTFFSAYTWFAPLALTPLFIGVWSGLFAGQYSKNKFWLTALVNLGGNVIGRIVISSICLRILYGTGFNVLLSTRIPSSIVMTAVEAAVIYLVLKSPVTKFSRKGISAAE